MISGDVDSAHGKLHVALHKNTFNPSLTAVSGGWLLACLTSKQHASVSQGRICSDNFT